MTITLASVTPNLGAVNKDIVLELTGAGFDVTTAVYLVSPTSPPIQYDLAGETIVSSNVMRASIAAGLLPLGFYDLVVTNGVDTATIPQAYRASVDLPTTPFLQNNRVDDVQSRMLSRIGLDPSGKPYDTRRGQVPWDMTAALAPEHERIYRRLDQLLLQGFAQFMGGVLLDLRAEEHGVLRKAATQASTVLEVTAPAGTVVPTDLSAGTTPQPNTTDQTLIFNSKELLPITVKTPVTGTVTAATSITLTDNTKAWTVDQWKGYTVRITLGLGAGQWRKVLSNTATTLTVLEWDTGSTPDVTSQYRLFTGVEVRTTTPGLKGNVLAGAINRLARPITFVTGVSNPVAATGGVDAESDRALLARFMLFVRSRSTGGNDTDYELWARETPGVNLGGVSVTPEWAGYGTVRVVIINADNSIPNVATVQAVYNYIQTKRPIGADVTVQAASAILVHARFALTVQPGYSQAVVEENTRQAIIGYINSLPVGGTDGYVMFYRVTKAVMDNVNGLETFDMYSSGKGIQRDGDPYSVDNVVMEGSEKPIAGTVTAV